MKRFKLLTFFTFILFLGCSKNPLFTDYKESTFHTVPDSYANTPLVSIGGSFCPDFVIYTPLNFYAVDMAAKRVFISDKEIINFLDISILYEFLEKRSAGDYLIYLRREKEKRQGIKRRPLIKL